MKTSQSNRRQFLASATASVAAVTCLRSATAQPVAAADAAGGNSDARNPYWFGYALNTSTIRGQDLDLVEEIEVTAEAGYDGIEPWTSKIHKYAESGGSLRDVRKRCADLGLQVCSGIGFANWVVDDDQRRAEGVEQLKRDMDALAQIGGTHIAAPPAGANRPGTTLDLDRAADRYRAILEIGREIGVIPQLEVWGPSANLSRGSQAMYVAARADHPDACLLLDAYHMYKGGTPVSIMKLIGREALHCYHMNDYPADPPRESIRDSQRIWPGDGIAPLTEILTHMANNHCQVMLSLELFNPEYWKLPALDAAKLGLEKIKASVAVAGLETSRTAAAR
jgi:sugar phosphate isomerase/epimerase